MPNENKTVSFEELKNGFKTPPSGFGVSLFYWWLGDKLTKERMRWQLDKIKDHSVMGLQIAYAHDNKGGRYLGLPFKSDPPQRSEEWWEFFNWLVEQGKKDGFAVSLSDYTLCWPGQGDYGDAILEEHPDTVGCELKSIEQKCRAGEEVSIEIPENALSVAAVCKKKMALKIYLLLYAIENLTGKLNLIVRLLLYTRKLKNTLLIP